LNSSTEIRMR